LAFCKISSLKQYLTASNELIDAVVAGCRTSIEEKDSQIEIAHGTCKDQTISITDPEIRTGIIRRYSIAIKAAGHIAFLAEKHRGRQIFYCIINYLMMLVIMAAISKGSRFQS
jgi:hypothetical protein